MERRARVGLDANVLIAASLLPRWPYEVLKSARDGQVDLVLPDQVVDEALRHLKPAGQRFLRRTLELTPHERVPMAVPDESSADLVRDTEDIPIALALLAAEVDYLVTNDRDFTDPGAVAERFSSRVRILLPARFLRDVLGWSSDDLEAIRGRTWTDIRDTR